MRIRLQIRPVNPHLRIFVFIAAVARPVIAGMHRRRGTRQMRVRRLRPNYLDQRWSEERRADELAHDEDEIPPTPPMTAMQRDDR